MLLSHNRIIKVKKPISRIAIIPADSNSQRSKTGDDSAPSSTNNKALRKSPSKQETITLTKLEFQEKLEAYYRKGIKAGKAESHKKAFTEFSEARQTLSNLIETVIQQQQNIIIDSENYCLELVFAMAEKVVKELNSQQKDLIKNILHQALKEAEVSGKIKIRVSHQDLERIQIYEAELRQSSPDIKELAIVADEAILQGGCVVETELGKLDARIETQLKEMTTGLRKYFKDLEQSET